MQGFVVQNSVLQIAENCKYQGTFKYGSWPTAFISNIYSARSRFSTEKNYIFEFMDEYLDKTFSENETYLCDSIELVVKYTNALKDNGENVRILFIQTTNDFHSSVPNDFFSAIYDDLYINVPVPMQKHTKLLNSSGIFSEYSSAKDFLLEIDRSIDIGYNLEPADGFDIIKLYEYIIRVR